MPATSRDVLTCLSRMADVIEENKKYLTKLDSPIGDADHGVNLNRGFKAILDKTSSLEDEPAGTILRTAGTALVSNVGGAAGPLYGSGLMQAGSAVSGKHELDAEDILKALEAALEGVVKRGKASPGDKTMVDTLTAAVAAMERAVKAGAGTAEALDEAAQAGKQAMKDTIPMLARKGRASYLGERSIGHQDPGATSTYLLIQVLADCAREKELG